MSNKLKHLQNILQKTTKNKTRADLDNLVKHTTQNFHKITKYTSHQTESEQIVNSEKKKK